MQYREIFAVCSEIHTKQLIILCEQHIEIRLGLTRIQLAATFCQLHTRAIYAELSELTVRSCRQLPGLSRQ
jgi:hypothetical protein